LPQVLKKWLGKTGIYIVVEIVGKWKTNIQKDSRVLEVKLYTAPAHFMSTPMD
jgi:hypothetical protein